MTIAIITTYRAQANLIRESIRRVVGDSAITLPEGSISP